MPLTRISLRQGKPASFKRAVMTEVYEAMRETFNVPEDDRFMTITEHGEDAFWFGRHYLGISRSDELIMIQITANNTRSIEQKKALYRRIVERLVASLGIRVEDVFISLVEVAKENWSFGDGEAQYA